MVYRRPQDLGLTPPGYILPPRSRLEPGGLPPFSELSGPNRSTPSSRRDRLFAWWYWSNSQKNSRKLCKIAQLRPFNFSREHLGPAFVTPSSDASGTASMYHGSCPTPDELGLFLDEQLEPPRQAEIGTHVDKCLSCQTVLETLTQRRAVDLIGLSTESLQGSEGYGAQDQIPTDPPERIDDGVNGLRRPDDEREPSSQVDGDLPLDPDRTMPYVPPAGPGADTGRPETGLQSDLPQIASYEILEVLGEGGMGVVYKARQRGLNRLVAVKMIRRDRPGGPDRLARFLIEAEAVARLRHPNIVQIFEIGEVDDGPYLSLELLDGGSLARRLAGTPQPGRPAAELMITLARAVQVAHDAGIIHRDLKPSNILFTEDGIPKITDFGLAKRLESDSGQTVPGQIMGSPSYMAPEQARGLTRDVGPAADVYALGAILYEMLTGRPPFKGETPVETVRQVTDDEVVPPSRLVPRVARDLETICLHCLKKEQSRRYGSARALAEDLERFLAGHPIKARRTPFWERAEQTGSAPPHGRGLAGSRIRRDRGIDARLARLQLPGNPAPVRFEIQDHHVPLRSPGSPGPEALGRRREGLDPDRDGDPRRASSSPTSPAGPARCWLTLSREEPRKRPGARPRAAGDLSPAPPGRAVPRDPLRGPGPSLRPGNREILGAFRAGGFRPWGQRQGS